MLLARLRLATRSPGRVLCNYQSVLRPTRATLARFRNEEDSHAAIEVHAVDTNRRIVLDAQVDVLANTKSKVASLREILLAQFILLYFESSLKNLLCLHVSNHAGSHLKMIQAKLYLSLGSSYSHMDGNLFVTSDAEGSDRIPGFAWKETDDVRYAVGNGEPLRERA